MKMRLAVGVLAVLWAGLLAKPAQAWNGTGHRIVALIAWDNLKPEVQAKIGELLRKHPQFKEYLEDGKAGTPADGNRAAFLTAATWADIVRSPVGKNRLYAHSAWHYMDIPFLVGELPDGTPKPPEVEAEWKAGTDPANILQALEKCMAELKDASAKDEDKAVALAWLEHLVGDLHQPLHTTSLFNADFPTSDRGGNSVMVTDPESTHADKVTNLHSAWDQMMGTDDSYKNVRELATKVEEEHPRKELAEQLKAAGYKAWGEESNGEAKEVVYLGGKIGYVAKDKYTADKTVAVPALTKEYLEKGHALARKKMALAGYRLAEKLNDIFAEGRAGAGEAAPAPATGP